MQNLIETSDFGNDVQVITETKNTASGKAKNYYIEGIFLQGGIKNRNKRIYPVTVLEKEVRRYNNDHIQKQRALGELNHPPTPTINLDRVSHKIESLVKEGNNFIGRAKLLETPMGKIAKVLVDEGVLLGVSSRGMGSLHPGKNMSVVGEDFHLATPADIVSDPSAPDAFVRGIMEGAELFCDTNLVEQETIEDIKKNIKSASSRKLEQVKFDSFKRYLDELSS